MGIFKFIFNEIQNETFWQFYTAVIKGGHDGEKCHPTELNNLFSKKRLAFYFYIIYSILNIVQD
jgi:hypothetical protein